MIISKKDKFIFIKSRKTAGSSIQIALSRMCGDALIIGSVDNGKVDESNTAGRNRADVISKLDHPHTNIFKIGETVKDWKDYFTFTWVRNPFEIVVSRYLWDFKKAGQSDKTSVKGFRRWIVEYCKSRGACGQDFLHQYYSYDAKTIGVDFIGRYENLQDDFNTLCEKLGYEPVKLGWHKQSDRKLHYSFYYDDETIEIVKHRFAIDFKMLGYEFERVKTYDIVGTRRKQVLDIDNLHDDNINGATVIKTPSFIDIDDKYMMYFANHRGKHIRLATGNSFDKMIIHEGGTLQLDQTVCKTHIASPDIMVKEDSLLMYFHGDTDRDQRTFKATSTDGINFEANDFPMAHFYFRRFGKYAIAKKQNKCGIIYRLLNGRWMEYFELLPNMRHAYPQVDDNVLSLFYTLAGDIQEHIRICVINMDNWEVVNDYELMRPEKEWEGAELPKEASRFGAAVGRVNELRDPFVFTEGKNKYLFYSYAGESGIAYTKLK